MPENFVIGEKITLRFTVEDDVLTEPFINITTLTASPQTEHRSGSNKQRDGMGSGGDGSGPTGIALPNIIQVQEKDWDKYKFDRYTACDIVQDADEANEDNSVYTFRVNIDNLHLQTEIKGAMEDPRLSRTKFVFGNVLVGLAIVQYFKEHEKPHAGGETNGRADSETNLPEELTVEAFAREATRAIAPFILPMINQLGALSEDEVATLGAIGDDE